MREASREEDLLREAQGGSELALTLLLKASHARLSGYLARRIPSDLRRVVDASDLVQETHVDVFRTFGSFLAQGPGSFDRWMFTIAIRNLRDAIKHHRRAKRGGTRQPARAHGARGDSMIGLLDMIAGPETTASRVFARAEAVRAVEQALTELSDDQRQAIGLVHIEGRPIAQAAKAMNRSERSIHGLLRRGLENLRERLGRESWFLSLLG